MRLHKPGIDPATSQNHGTGGGQPAVSGRRNPRSYAAYWLAAAGAAGAAGAEAPFFVFCFLARLTCFWVGGEYELTELLATGAAVWATATELPTASERPAKMNVSFFMRVSP
jgi:hypothetical protein